MTRRRLGLAAGAVALAALGALALRPSGEPALVGTRAPTFETFDLQGAPVRLADYAGRPVLVNFWASWCVPCRREFPLLETVHEAGAVQVLGVVFRDSTAAAAVFMREQGAGWPGLVDPDGDIAEAYEVRLRPGLPVTVAVAADGSLVARHVGELRRPDLDALLAAATTPTPAP